MGGGIKIDNIAAYLGFVYCERQKRITGQGENNKTGRKEVSNNIFNEILEEFFNTGGAEKDKYMGRNDTTNFGFGFNIVD